MSNIIATGFNAGSDNGEMQSLGATFGRSPTWASTRSNWA